MWIPKTAAEVQEAATRGDLEETHTFDAKSALPAPKKNHDLAVDVDAMTVDGGSLLYGLGENENSRLTVLAPVELAGAYTVFPGRGLVARPRVVAAIEDAKGHPLWSETPVAERVVSPQAAFLATNGYNHHVGANTWQSEGAPYAPADRARLIGATIYGAPEELSLSDPSGIPLTFVTAA